MPAEFVTVTLRVNAMCSTTYLPQELLGVLREPVPLISEAVPLMQLRYMRVRTRGNLVGHGIPVADAGVRPGDCALQSELELWALPPYSVERKDVVRYQITHVRLESRR